MPEELLIPRKLALATKQGFDRMRRHTRARAMFIREYVGQYYRETFGLAGDEPINLIFQTIRATVPNLVMANPVNEVTTEIIPHQEYAFLLSLALNNLGKQLDLKTVLRMGIVDALFTMAIFKTGLASGGSMLDFGGGDFIEEGQIFTDVVSLDDFVFDPSCRDRRKAAFKGDRNRVPRQILLDDDEFNHDLVMKIPRSRHPDAKRKVEALTQSNLSNSEMYELQDYVDIVELHVPGAEALITIPDPEQAIFDDYLAARDYYGPESGPYTELSLSQPVSDNPMPVAPVGVWYDMHKIANRIMLKIMNQAERQKKIAVVDPSGADEAEDIRDSEDGEVIFGRPDTVKEVSLGGQDAVNERVLGQIQVWYNYMAGNPEQMAGLSSNANTATQATILQGNANVSIEDMRQMIYDVSSEINSKHAWYLHTDPLIDVPMTFRKPGGERIQLQLTPEQRRGDFLEYVFNIKPGSMSRLDPNVKSQRIIAFAQSIVPSLAQTAMVCMQLGLPFNLPTALTDIAEEQGILDEVQDWFVDPMFMQRMELVAAMGPQNAGKASATPKAGRQEKGFGSTPRNPGPNRTAREESQQVAGQAQSEFKGAGNG